MKQPKVIYALVNVNGIIVDVTTNPKIAHVAVVKSHSYNNASLYCLYIKHMKPLSMRQARLK